VKPYYSDEFVTLYLGDCREIAPTLDAGSVDFVFTDPPYGHNNNNNGDLAHRREAALGIAEVHGEARPIAGDDFDEANALVQFAFAEFSRLLKPGGCCCCCCCGGGPDPQFARWSLWLDDALGFKQAVVWDKGGLGMGWHYRRNYELVLVGEKPGAKCKWYGGNDTPNVFRLSGLKPSATDHPTPKPEGLVGHFLGLHSLPGDLVLDPFAGGGTTLIVAKRLQRRAVGIEIDERWAEHAAKRLSQGVLWTPTQLQEFKSASSYRRLVSVMTDDQLDLFSTLARSTPAMPFAMRDEIADAEERQEPGKVQAIKLRGVEVIRSSLL
jgi:DNA modification methylase